MAKKFCGSPVYRQFVGARNDLLAVRSSTASGARSVFYTGPCPQADPNDQTNMDSAVCSGICQDICGGCPCTEPSGEAAYAFYADAGTVCLAAGDAFALDESVYSIGPIEKDRCRIEIGQAGRYLAVFTITGRALDNLNSLVTLRRNGNTVPGASAEVRAMQGETVGIVRRVVFNANAGDVLQLVTSSAMRLCGMPAVTLTIVRVG